MAAPEVVVVGAGHNGLVAAAYLAQAGKRVVVLERGDQVGGAAVTEELWPGFRVSSCADGSGYLSVEVRRDLELDRHGLEILPAAAVVFAPQPDGSQLTIWRDATRTASEIAPHSASDADRYPAFVEQMSRIAAVFAAIAGITPPDLPEVGWRKVMGMRSLTGPLRRLGRKNLNELMRVLPMPVADLLDEWFESDPLRGAVAAGGVRDLSWGPKEAGTAYGLLYHWGLADTGLFRSAGVVKGGMGGLTAALAAAARSHGAEIRTGAPVRRILVRDGAAGGVELESGERLVADIVVSNADPRTTFLTLIDPTTAGARFIRHVRNLKYRGTAARIHLGLRALPEFTALPDGDLSRLGGAIQIAPGLEYLQRAYDHAKYGQFSPHPYLDITIPTVLDPALAPPGHHVMSITAKYAPYLLRAGSWNGERHRFIAAVMDKLAEYAPNIRDIVVDQAAWLPPDLEARFGLPEGSPHHGEMSLDQLFHMRPVPGWAGYATPVGGLFMCGAGCHPGGGVTGLPGRNAAREVLRS